MRCTECKDFFCKHRSQSTTGGECFYESKEQMENRLAIKTEATLDYVDWSAFRREAAKDLLPLAADLCDHRGGPEAFVKMSIRLADELIKALRNG